MPQAPLLGLHPYKKSLSELFPDLDFIKPMRLHKLIDWLSFQGATSVTFVGSPGSLGAAFTYRMGQPDALLISYMKKVGFFSLPHSYLRSVILALRDRDIEIRSVGDVFPEMWAPKGFFLGEYDVRDIASIYQRAVLETRRQPMFFVRQSHIVCGDIVLSERLGTDELIMRFGRVQSKGSQPAFLCKVPVANYLDIDTPVIGLKTAQLCLDQGITGIILKSKETIIANQVEIKTEFWRSGLFIFGA